MARRRGKGEGSIFKRQDGSWQGQISIGYDANGKRKRVTVYGTTQREVREKLEKIRQEIAKGTFTDEKILVGDYLEHWHAEKARQVKPRTVELYGRYIRTHISPRIGKIQLKKLTPLQVQAMTGDIADKVGVRTANICRTILFSALKQAVRWQLVAHNVVEAVDPLKEITVKMKLWTPKEIHGFLEAAKEHRLFAAFYLMIATGLRRGELLGLRWQDVQEDMVLVEQALTLVEGKVTFSSPKTEQGSRLIVISADVVDVLAEHRERQEEERAYLGDAWTESGLVFTSELGTPLHPRNFERTWYMLLRKSGVTKIRLHDLRHLHVSLLVREGLDPRTIADRVGHTDPAFTLRRYSHMFEKQRKAAAINLMKLLEDEEAEEKRKEDNESDTGEDK